jgi:hypothetical protein
MKETKVICRLLLTGHRRSSSYGSTKDFIAGSGPAEIGAGGGGGGATGVSYGGGERGAGEIEFVYF